MPAWPASLPSLDKIAGASVVPVSNSTVIDVESGEPLTRRRFTGDMDDIAMSLLLSGDQRIDLYNFWRLDLEDGTLRFTHAHPLTGEMRAMLFMTPPRFTPLGNNLWRCEVAVRSMPE